MFTLDFRANNARILIFDLAQRRQSPTYIHTTTPQASSFVLMVREARRGDDRKDR